MVAALRKRQGLQSLRAALAEGAGGKCQRAMMVTDKREGLGTVLEKVEAAPDGDKVAVGEVVGSLGRRSFGPLLIIVTLVAMLPTGAIPGVSAVTGTLMLIFCLQLLFGKEEVWIPRWVAKLEIDRERLQGSLDRVRGFARRVDKLLKPRLERFVQPPFVNLVGLVGALLALTMYPLIPVPFGAFPASVPLFIFGIGLAARDGLMILTGLSVSLGAAWGAWLLWPF